MDKSEESKKIESYVVGSNTKDNNCELEDEWLELVREAMESGITKKQFQDFLESEAQKKNF